MANNIIQFSGGKDSTAMVLEMLKRGEKIHSVVTFDTGWEFPGMYDHWKKFEQITGLKITVLHPKESFDYTMFDRPIKARKGPLKGQIHRIGNGWPSWTRRWCTRIKVNALDKFKKNNSRSGCLYWICSRRSKASANWKDVKFRISCSVPFN